MFFRESYSKKSITPILQLVENTHTPKGARQRLIISLGRMQIVKEIRRGVAARVETILMGQESFVPIPQEVEKYAQEIANQIRTQGKWENAKRVTKIDIPDASTEAVFIDQIKHTNDCELGPELVAYQMCKRLNFEKILMNLSFNDIETKIAIVSVLSRLIRPQSENNIKPWLKNTGLPELLDLNPEKIYKDRYYRISDKLIRNKEAIEDKLVKEETSLFNLKRNIILYDLTNTYFEGECAEHHKVTYGGKSKEKRNDCPMIGIGLVVDEEGFPLKHKIFSGNTSDSKTIIEIINELKKDIKDVIPTVIIDAGMSSENNLKIIRAAGFDYIVMMKRSLRASYPEVFDHDELFTKIEESRKDSQVNIYKQKEAKYWEITKKDFIQIDSVDESVSESIWKNLKDCGYLDQKGNLTDKAKLLKSNHLQLDSKFHKYNEQIASILLQAEYGMLYCKSDGRKKKEKAIKNKSRQKIEDDLAKLASRIQKGQLKDEEKINQRIGRLKERHSRVSRFYDIILKNENTIKELTWEYEEPQHEPEGNYVIKTSRVDLDGEELWKLYMTLTRVEAAFKNLKSDLGLRPNRHYKEDRIDGHIFITILAYHILHAIEYSLRLNDDHRTWPTIKQSLETHCYSTLIIPTVKGPVINMRSPGEPDSEQKKIYNKLNINYKNLPTKKIFA